MMVAAFTGTKKYPDFGSNFPDFCALAVKLSIIDLLLAITRVTDNQLFSLMMAAAVVTCFYNLRK